MLKALRFGFWFWVVLSLAAVAGYWAGKPLLQRDCLRGPLVSQFPNLKLQDGFFSNPDAAGGMKLLYCPVQLSPRIDYTVSFTVREVQGKEPVALTLDLYGDGYNFDEQKIRIQLQPGVKNKVYRETLYAGGAVPALPSLRLYFDAPAAVSLGKVKFTGEYRYARRALAWILLAGVLGAFGFGWAWLRKDPAAFPWVRRLSGLRGIQLGFVLAFFAVLLLPSLQNEFKLFQYQPVDENRRKLDPPSGNLSVSLYQQGSDYSKAYEKFFNDHYGLRDFLIKLKNQIDYTCFHRSDEVFIGRDHWMEYRNVLAGQMIFAERHTPKDWDDIYNHVEALRRFLAKRKVTLVLVPIQLKFSFYPEFAPDNLVRRPTPTAFERFVDHFRHLPGYLIVDERAALLEAQKKYPIFYKTDFHWNGLGAFFGARAVVDALAQDARLPLRWDHPLEYTVEPGFVGGLNRSLAVFFPPLEGTTVIRDTWKHRGTFLTPESPFEVHFRANAQEAAHLLPPTVLIGNSFSYNFIQVGFYEYFSEIRLLHSKHISQLPQVLPAGTRYVALQFIESDIGVFFWRPEFWPTLTDSGEAAGATPGRQPR